MYEYLCVCEASKMNVIIKKSKMSHVYLWCDNTRGVFPQHVSEVFSQDFSSPLSHHYRHRFTNGYIKLQTNNNT